MVRGKQRTCDCGTCQKCRHREYMRAYLRANPEKKTVHDRQRQADRARERHRRRLIEEPGYAQAHRARCQVTRALRQGVLVRGECEMADDECLGRIEGHHDDYSKPLEVRWLCVHHHCFVDRFS